MSTDFDYINSSPDKSQAKDDEMEDLDEKEWDDDIIDKEVKTIL
jgi:hypothetical protein